VTSRKKKILFYTSFVFMLLMGAVLLAEVGFRVYNKFNPMYFFDTSYDRFRGKPHSEFFDTTLNSMGYNDEEVTKEKGEGLFRIVGLGDSFVLGKVPYKYNFLTVLEEKLRGNKRKVEIVNMGIPGVGLNTYLHMLANESLALNPDMVMCFLYVGNDFIEEMHEETHEVEPLFVWAFLKHAYDLLSSYEGVVRGGHTYEDDKPTFSLEKYVEIQLQTTFIYEADGKVFNQLLRKVLERIRLINEICKRNGIELVVVLIPDESQLDEKLQNMVVNRFIEKAKAGDRDYYIPAGFDFMQPNRELTALLRENGIRFIDLLPPFYRESLSRRLYKPNDGHWNIAGNALAADLLFEELGPKIVMGETQ
jgi:hypothetical protein